MADDFDFDTPDDDEDDVELDLTTDPKKGENVTKNRFANIIGVAPMTLDKFIREGMAGIVERGSKAGRWTINTAAAINWLRRRDVQLNSTKGKESVSFDAAKRRDKEAQAKVRELQYERLKGRTLYREEMELFLDGKFAVLRSHLMNISGRVSQAAAVTSDPAEIEELIKREIDVALQDIDQEESSDD
jgi:phage terminase Nu1 subunit (DNA packaging protein)